MRRSEKETRRWPVACVVLAIGICCCGRGGLAQVEGTGENAEKDKPATSSKAKPPVIDFQAIQAEYDAKRKAKLDKLRTDSDWQATHKEVSVIDPVPDSAPNAIHNFCLNLDGNLLVCCGGDRTDPWSLKLDLNP